MSPYLVMPRDGSFHKKKMGQKHNNFNFNSQQDLKAS